MASRTQTDLSLVVLGLLGWAAAGLFAVLPLTVKVEAPSPAGGKVEIQAANPAAVGASCGFAIGGRAVLPWGRLGRRAGQARAQRLANGCSRTGGPARC
jgi:hypothetical protein